MKNLYFLASGITLGLISFLLVSALSPLAFKLSDVTFLNDILFYGIIALLYAQTNYEKRPIRNAFLVALFMVLFKNMNKVVLINLLNSINLKLLVLPIFIGTAGNYLGYWLINRKSQKVTAQHNAKSADKYNPFK